MFRFSTTMFIFEIVNTENWDRYWLRCLNLEISVCHFGIIKIFNIGEYCRVSHWMLDIIKDWLKTFFNLVSELGDWTCLNSVHSSKVAEKALHFKEYLVIKAGLRAEQTNSCKFKTVDLCYSICYPKHGQVFISCLLEHG